MMKEENLRNHSAGARGLVLELEVEPQEFGWKYVKCSMCGRVGRYALAGLGPAQRVTCVHCGAGLKCGGVFSS